MIIHVVLPKVDGVLLEVLGRTRQEVLDVGLLVPLAVLVSPENFIESDIFFGLLPHLSLGVSLLASQAVPSVCPLAEHLAEVDGLVLRVSRLDVGLFRQLHHHASHHRVPLPPMLQQLILGTVALQLRQQ